MIGWVGILTKVKYKLVGVYGRCWITKGWDWKSSKDWTSSVWNLIHHKKKVWYWSWIILKERREDHPKQQALQALLLVVLQQSLRTPHQRLPVKVIRQGMVKILRLFASGCKISFALCNEYAFVLMACNVPSGTTGGSSTEMSSTPGGSTDGSTESSSEGKGYCCGMPITRTHRKHHWRRYYSCV